MPVIVSATETLDPMTLERALELAEGHAVKASRLADLVDEYVPGSPEATAVARESTAHAVTSSALSGLVQARMATASVLGA